MHARKNMVECQMHTFSNVLAAPEAVLRKFALSPGLTPECRGAFLPAEGPLQCARLCLSQRFCAAVTWFSTGYKHTDGKLRLAKELKVDSNHPIRGVHAWKPFLWNPNGSFNSHANACAYSRLGRASASDEQREVRPRGDHATHVRRLTTC